MHLNDRLSPRYCYYGKKIINDYFVKMNKLINAKHTREALNVTSHQHSNKDLTTNYLTSKRLTPSTYNYPNSSDYLSYKNLTYQCKP